MKCGLYLKLGWRTHLPFAFRTTALCWLCCDESLVREDICCGVQTDASQHRHHFGLSQPAPAAPSLNRAETYSHPCLLINTETSSKANSFWQRCQGPMLTSSPVFNWAEFLSLYPSLTSPRLLALLTKSIFSYEPVMKARRGEKVGEMLSNKR